MFYQSVLCHPDVLSIGRTHVKCSPEFVSINTNTLNANWEIICLPLDPTFTIIFRLPFSKRPIGCRTPTSNRILFHCILFLVSVANCEPSNVCLFQKKFIWITCYNFNATTERMGESVPKTLVHWSILIGFLVSLSKYSNEWSLKTMQFNKTQTNRLYGRKWSKTWTTNGNFQRMKYE